VAVVQRGADQVFSSATVSVQAGLTGAACVSVVAGDPVLFGRLLTESSGIVADPRVQAVTGVGAAHVGGRYTDPHLAGLAVGAEASVVADRIVRLWRIGAESGLQVTDTYLVAVIHGCADDGIARLTGGFLAEVIHGTSVAIVTNGTDWFGWVVADPGLWEADAYVVALAQGFTHNGLSAHTGAVEAAVIGGAEVVVVAGGAVVLVGEDAITRRRVAEHSGLTLVGIWAVKVRYCSTNATGALFSQRAEAAIIADDSILFLGIRADPGSGVADARDVAIVQRGADQVFSSATVSVQAGLTGAASVSVVTDESTLFRCLLTESSGVVADPCFQAIACVGATHVGGRYTDPHLAGLTVGAEAAVVTDRVVRLRWVAATSTLRVAETGHVAVIHGCTDHRISGLTGCVLTEIYIRTGVAVVAVRTVILGWRGTFTCFRDTEARVVALA
jgi:hypothetical protein